MADAGVPQHVCPGEGRALQGWEEPIQPRGTLSPYLPSNSSERTDDSVFGKRAPRTCSPVSEAFSEPTSLVREGVRSKQVES